jgi:uncharacterized protein YbaR (Trm112 family)
LWNPNPFGFCTLLNASIYALYIDVRAQDHGAGIVMPPPGDRALEIAFWLDVAGENPQAENTTKPRMICLSSITFSWDFLFDFESHECYWTGLLQLIACPYSKSRLFYSRRDDENSIKKSNAQSIVSTGICVASRRRSNTGPIALPADSLRCLAVPSVSP